LPESRSEKKKALGPCELKALLYDQPSSPCTRHSRRRITWHRRTLRSTTPATFGGKARTHHLSRFSRRDRNCFRSLQGRVTTATPVPGNWTSRLCPMTGRREGCVSTMLTESDLSISLPMRHFKGLARRNGGCKPTSTAFQRFCVLTPAVGPHRYAQGVGRRRVAPLAVFTN